MCTMDCSRIWIQILTGPRTGWVKHGRNLTAWREGSKITVGTFPVVMVGAQLKLFFSYRFGGCNWGVDFYSPHPYYPIQDMTDKVSLDISHSIDFRKTEPTILPPRPTLSFIITLLPCLFHSRCIISLFSRCHSMYLPGSFVTILFGTLEPFP